MAAEAYQIQLDNFEGPLDLLLYFIRRDEMEITDIPIARITSEYLHTLDMMQSENVSVAGEFVLMAATLMRIKARMLLPRSELNEEGEIIDPRTGLMQQLLEYQRFKEVAGNFESLAEEQRQFFIRSLPMEVEDDGEDPGVYLRSVSLFDLANYFNTALQNRPVMQSYELHRETLSLDDQKQTILNTFDGEGKLKFSTMIERVKTKIEVIITFLALLDLIRLNQVIVYQNKLFDDLEIHLISPA